MNNVLRLDPHSKDHFNMFINEIESMKRVGKHENVIRFLGCSKSICFPCYIVELAENGNLLDLLRRCDVNGDDIAIILKNNCSFLINLQEKIKFAIQVSFGMEYLASLKVVTFYIYVSKLNYIY